MKEFNWNGASARVARKYWRVQLKRGVDALFKEALRNSIAKRRVEEIQLKRRVDARCKHVVRYSNVNVLFEFKEMGEFNWKTARRRNSMETARRRFNRKPKERNAINSLARRRAVSISFLHYFANASTRGFNWISSASLNSASTRCFNKQLIYPSLDCTSTCRFNWIPLTRQFQANSSLLLWINAPCIQINKPFQWIQYHFLE